MRKTDSRPRSGRKAKNIFAGNGLGAGDRRDPTILRRRCFWEAVWKRLKELESCPGLGE